MDERLGGIQILLDKTVQGIDLISQAKRIALCRIFVGLDWMGVSEFWDESKFYPFWDVFFTNLVLE